VSPKEPLTAKPPPGLKSEVVREDSIGDMGLELDPGLYDGRLPGV
jgi:hypothetical protein